MAKLEVSFVGDTCLHKVGLFMRINHASDIRGLKGYMIFAYPELKEISRVKNLSRQLQQLLTNLILVYHILSPLKNQVLIYIESGYFT